MSLSAQNNQSMFISAIYCSIDLKTLDLTIANAGHPYPIIKKLENNKSNVTKLESKVEVFLG